MGQPLDGFPNVKAWVERVGARPAVQRAMEVGAEFRRNFKDMSKEQQAASAKHLFGQTAASVAAAAKQG